MGNGRTTSETHQMRLVIILHIISMDRFDFCRLYRCSMKGNAAKETVDDMMMIEHVPLKDTKTYGLKELEKSNECGEDH